MTTTPFVFVDVFTAQPLAGNPVALVPDGDSLRLDTRRAIAREFNQSETTFILSPTVAGADWRLQSFTPIGAEVFGAGHNALGAWLWLTATGRVAADRSHFVQQIGEELLPVEVLRSSGRPPVVSMDQSPPVFGRVVDDRDALASALGLAAADMDAGRPAQVVSTGAGHLLVPLRDRSAVDAAAPDSARLAAVLRAVGGEGCYIYSLDPVDPTDAVAYSRFFNPTMGIHEDPATGTAAGPLVAQLVADGLLADGTTTVIEQGYTLGRPSRIHVTVDGERVRVSGSGVIAAQGALHLPGQPGQAQDVDDADLAHLRRAIALASDAKAAGDPPFGSLLVSAGGAVLAEDCNTTVTDDDITAHPELKLARWAARHTNIAEAPTMTMYTSCRPCPMCASAIRRARIGRVVFALDTNQLDALKPLGFQNPDAADVHHVGPALLEEARRPIENYYH